MKQLLIISTILTLLTVSCQLETTERSDEIHELKPNIDFSFLVGTFDLKTTVKIQKEFGTANYPPLYFGTNNDTIYINYKLPQYSLLPPTPITVSGDTLFKPDPKFAYELMNLNHKKYSEYFQQISIDEYLQWDSASFEVKVDTTRTNRNIDFRKLQDSTFVFKAYPVIIENKTDKKVAIGYGSHIALLLEAKNEKGKWQKIEKPFTYFCGTGLPSIILPKGEIALTSVPIFQGDFETDLRLKIGDNYSEIFNGYIDMKQFEKERE